MICGVTNMLSWAALNGLVEEKAASDAKYRQEIAGRPLRSHAARMTDPELLDKLRSFGVELDRPDRPQRLVCSCTAAYGYRCFSRSRRRSC